MNIIKNLLSASILLCIILSMTSCSKEYSSDKEADYSKVISEVYDAELYMPRLDELGNYKTIRVTRKTPNGIFFGTTDSVSLIVEYEKTEFDLEYARVLSKYKFVQSANEYVMDIEANVGGYNILIVDDPDFYTEFTHGETALTGYKLLMIGVDTENSKIAYLYHWDDSCGSIKNLDDFVENKYVIK